MMTLMQSGKRFRIWKGSFDYLPLLPTGTCILAGLLANVPIVIDIAKIEPTKQSLKTDHHSHRYMGLIRNRPKFSAAVA
jgi:hypothetical protein